jgi:membrane-bound inhibitor of C-type lysozyme
VFGENIYESTTMDSVISTGGHKSLLYLGGDAASQAYIVADRIGMSIVNVPSLMSAAGNLATYQSGFAMFWRTGADSSVQGTSTGIRNLTLT